jgi:ABC-2 type transport system ATP-binding protein
MDRMLQLEGLTKRFGDFTAVDGISFSVHRGEVLGFLGPNGAGKTTAMRMVTGFLPPTSGTAIVAGHDVTLEPIAVKSRIGYLPEGAPLYEDMTPLELLGFVAEVRGISGADKRKAIDRAAEVIDIGAVMRQSIGTLSKGFKRRVGIAQAILHDPELLILDEPTDGLDPNQKHEVRRLINEMAENKVIVISTHLLEEVEVVCTRAIVIARGSVVADGTPADLEARSIYHNAVTIRLDASQLDSGKTRIEAVADVDRVETVQGNSVGDELIAFPKEGKVIVDAVGGALNGAGINVHEIRSERGRLDEVFRRLTTVA